MTSETDIDYEAVFGIEIGENEQEAAEPATDTEEEQGEKEQEEAIRLKEFIELNM